MAALRPAAVAVHDDGEVLGESLEIKFIEKLRFFAVGGFEKFAAFTQFRSGTDSEEKLAYAVGASKADGDGRGMAIAVMLRKAGEACLAEEKAGARPRTPYRFALARRSCRAACSASCAYTARSREILRFAQDDGKGKLKFRVKSWRT